MADLRLQIWLGAVEKVSAPMKRVRDSVNATATALAGLERAKKDISGFHKLRSQLRASTAEAESQRANLEHLRQTVDRHRDSQQELAASVRMTRAQMKTYDAQMMRSVAPTKEMAQRHLETGKRLHALEKRYLSSQSAMRKHKAALRAAEQASKTLGNKQADLKDKLDRAKNALERSGISTAQMAGKQRALRSEIARTTTELDRQTRAQERLTAARERSERIRQRARSMHEGGKGLMQTGFGAYHLGRRALTTGVHALAPGLAFDASMSKVQALTGLDRDDARYGRLREDARNLAARTKFNPAEVAEGQRFLAMAGFDPEAILGSMQSMLNIAIAGNIDIPDAANIVSNISSAFAIDSSDMAAMTQLADQLVTGFSNANVDLTQLGETMKYFAPVAKAAGIDTATSIAMAGMLGNIGIQGSDAGTALRSMTTRLAAPPSEARKALDRLGVSAKDADGNLRNIVDIMAEIDAAFTRKGVGDADRLGDLKDIFGQRAMAGGSNLTELMADAMGNGAFDAYLGIIQNSQGNADKIAKVMADNLTGDWLNLVSAFQDVMLSLNDAVGPTLRALAQSVSALLLRLNVWVKANPQLAKVLGLAALAVAGLVTAFGMLAMGGGIALMMLSHVYKVVALFANSGVLTLVKGGLMLVGKAVLWLGRALMMNPIGLIITAIAVAAYLIYRYWEPIKGFFAGLWAGIVRAFEWAVEFIKTKLSWTPLGMVLNHWQPIKAFMAALWDGILDGLRSAWDLIVGVLKGAWDVIAGIFTGDGGRIMDGLGGIWDSIQTFMSGWPTKMLQFGVDMLKGLINGIKGMAGAVGNAITGAVSGAVDRFKAFLGIKSPSRLFAGLGDFTMLGYAGGIVRAQGEPVQAVLDMGQRLRKTAAGITLGVAGVAAPVLALELPEMPDMAAPVRAERPPVLASSAPVMAPSARSAPPAPAAAPMTINITINAPGGSAPDIAREVRRVLDQVEHERRARTRAWQHDYD